MDEHKKIQHEEGDQECPVCFLKIDKKVINDHVQAHELNDRYEREE